jgi:hypothetical protein
MHVQCSAVPRMAYASHLESCPENNRIPTRCIPESHLHAVTDDADRLAVQYHLRYCTQPALAWRVQYVFSFLMYVTQRLRPHVPSVPTGSRWLESGNGDEP